MEKNNTEKSRKMAQTSGIMFTLALVGVSALLFLFSDLGEVVCAKIGVSQTVYEPQPAKTAAPEEKVEESEESQTGVKEGLSADVFFARVEEHGAQFNYTLIHEDPHSKEYTLSGNFSHASELILSLSGGNVNEVILVCDIPVEPAPLPPDAGNILRSAYSKDVQRYEADIEWIISCVISCTMALDTEESVSHSEILEGEESIRSAVKNNEACEMSLGSFTAEFKPDGQGRIHAVVRAAE